jgi:hypothetical protein
LRHQIKNVDFEQIDHAHQQLLNLPFLSLPLFLTHAKLAQRLCNTTNQEFFMKKYLCILIALSQASTGLAMLPAKQECADGKTPLMKAVLIYRLSLAQIQENLPSIDVQDNQGRTALHYAAAFGDKNSMAMLEQAGADKNLVDKNNKTAEDLYKENKRLSGHCHEYFCNHHTNSVECEQTPTEETVQNRSGDERSTISVVYHPNTVNYIGGLEQKDYGYGYYANLTR